MAFILSNSVSVTTPSDENLLLDGLRISYDITKTNERSTNECECSIYNLSQDTINKIIEDSVVEVKTGYEDEGGLKNIFFGNVQRAETLYDFPEIRTTLKIYDGLLNIRESNISLGYVGGTSVSTIFQQLTNAIGLPVIGTSLIPTGAAYANGYNFTGKAYEALSEILGFVNIRYSIQNNQIVLSDGTTPILPEVYELSATSGLIKIPEDISDRDESQEPTEDIPKRYRVTALIIPEILPDSRISVISEKVTGIFIVEKVKFSGDNYGTNNFMDLEVIAA